MAAQALPESNKDRILARYPTMLKFMEVIGPDRQTLVGSNPIGYIGHYSPTLKDLSVWYGKPMAQAWLVPQIYEMVRFRGLKEGPSEHQYLKLSEIIVDTRGRLTVNEIQLFFYEMGIGLYEKFYGRFDPAVVLSSFPPFIRHINEIKNDYKMKLKQRQILK